MNQNRKAPESQEKSRWLRSGALKVPSASKDVELNVPVTLPVVVTKSMKQLLGEFKSLYEERLRRLEFETNGTQEERLRMKVYVLQSYVNDLADQNQVLAQTVEDLEKEADHRVGNLEIKLRTSNDDWSQQRRTLEQSACALRSENTDPRSDMNSLTQLIQRTGHTRNLDVSGVELRTPLVDEAVGPLAHGAHSPYSEVQLWAELEDLKTRLHTKDLIISGLQRELNSNKKEGSEVSEELAKLQSQLASLRQIHRDKMKEMAEKDVSVAELHSRIQLLQAEGADTQLSMLEERARELQEEVRRKEEQRRAGEEEWRRREDEWRERERRKRDEERTKRAEEEKRREEEWEKGLEDEREAHAQALTTWAEKVAILNAELERSREQMELQSRELSELHQKEETLLSELQAQVRRHRETQRVAQLREEEMAQLQRQLEETRRAHTLAAEQAEAKMASLRRELSASFERKMVEKEERINQLKGELSRMKEQVCDLQQNAWAQSTDLEKARQRYQEYVDDNARLRARLDAHTLSAHNQHEILTSELSSAEGQLHALKQQLQDKEKELDSAAHKIVCLESSLKEAEESCVGAKTEVQNHSLLLEEMSRELERHTQAERDAVLQVKEREEHVRHLEQDAVSVRATQDSLKRTLAMKEKHTQQLLQANAQLQDGLAALQSKFQTSDCMVRDVSQTLDQVKSSLNQEIEQRQQIQDQLHHANQEVERLQVELTQVRRAAEKKIQRRELKMCALEKDLTQSKKRYSDCHKELLSRQTILERLHGERDELRAKMEERSRECVSLNQTRERLETDLALSQEKQHTVHLEVRSRDQLILQLRAEMKAAEQKRQGTQEELSALEAEVRRLNKKVRGHQEEMCQLREKVREGEGLRDQKDKEGQQLHNQLCTSQQQVKSQAESIERLTSDLEAVKQAHRVDVERWSQRNFLLRRQSEQSHSELSQTQARLKEREAEVGDLKESLSRAEIGWQEAAEKVELSEGLIKRQEVELDLLCQQLKGAQEDLNEATVRAQHQEETAAIFKQKYAVAMEMVQRLQGQVESLEEELRYSQQQLRDSQVATHSVKAELAELEGRYQEKVNQWESSEEALDQLTDELQTNQNLLKESQEKVDRCEGLMATLKEQVNMLKQQKLMGERDLRLYQQTHSYSDEDYLNLLRHRQQLQKRCTEQIERLAEYERTVLQMKTELERQAQEKTGLERSLVASHHTHLTNCTQLQQEVTRLEQEVTRLQLELANTHKDSTQREQVLQMREMLLQQSEEDLKEARQEAERRSRDLEALQEEVQRLQEEVQREEGALRENPNLRNHIRQLSQELEELHSKHRLTVADLAARTEEARRMAGCLSEGKLAEEKRRLVVERLEREVTELTEVLQQAVEHRLKAEREKQHTQDQLHKLKLEFTELLHKLTMLHDNLQRAGAHGRTAPPQLEPCSRLIEPEEGELERLTADTLRLGLEGTRSDNASLRRESQLVMSNVNRWIAEQKASSENLAAQIKTQNKVLVIITDEKEHLQEANDTLKEELKALKEVVEEKEREMQRFKTHIRDQDAQRDDRSRERESCVALNLSKIEDMQTRLRSNLEAIRMLNQQLSALGGENERLRRQLEEERAARRRGERLLPPPPPPPAQQQRSVHLPFSLAALVPRPSPSPSPPHSLRLHRPRSPDLAPGDPGRTLTRAELSGAGPPGDQVSPGLRARITGGS